MVTVGDILKWVGILVVLAVLCLAGYVWYRYHAASTFDDNTDAMNAKSPGQLLESIRGIPPVKCVSVQSNFSGAVRTYIFIAYGKIRSSYEDLSRQDSVTGNTLQTLTDPTGFYAWRSGGDTANRIGLDTPYPSTGSGGQSPLVHISSCQPWWDVDQSLLKVPANFIIEDVRM